MDEGVHMNDVTIAKYKRQLQDCILLLERYQWIIDSFVLDFFLDPSLWLQFSESWRHCLASASPKSLASLLDPSESACQETVWPLSLLAFKQSIHALSLNRHQVKNFHVVKKLVKVQETLTKVNQVDNNANSDNFQPSLNKGVLPFEFYEEMFSVFSGHQGSLKHIFRKHVKPKKQYELARMGKFISDTMKQAGENKLIDVGAGVGHLARYLAYAHSLQVACVDSNNDFTDSAKKFDAQLEESVRKLEDKLSKPKFQSEADAGGGKIVLPALRNTGNVSDRITNASDRITNANDRNTNASDRNTNVSDRNTNVNDRRTNVSDRNTNVSDRRTNASDRNTYAKDRNKPAADFAPVHVTSYLAPDMDLPAFHAILSQKFAATTDNDLRYGIVGLHTCGDLAPVLIRMFINDSKAVMLHSVGCCYMKIQQHFPMSTFVQSIQTRWRFNYTNAELACHAIEMYRDRLRAGEQDKLKVHCYRAVLEKILVTRDKDLRHTILKSVAKAHEMSFKDYAIKAASNLKTEFEPSDFDTPEVRTELDSWWEVVVYYTIRLALAPLLETVILLDRCVALLETGHDNLLLPLFDPLLSPRNQILFAVKK